MCHSDAEPGHIMRFHLETHSIELNSSGAFNNNQYDYMECRSYKTNLFSFKSSTTLFWFIAIALVGNDNCPHTVYSHACTLKSMDFKHHIIWN